MPRMPLIVSHYTEDTPYEDLCIRLRESTEEHKLELHTYKIPHLGSWRANSNYCSTTILDALESTGRDILRVDCDAVFRQHPVIFDDPTFDADVAAVVYDFRWHPNELMGGTLYFRNSSYVVELVREWDKLCNETRKHERNGDLLKELLSKKQWSEPYMKFVKLPPSYCKIFDKMEDCKDADNPVIEHFQASRKNRMSMNTLKVKE